MTKGETKAKTYDSVVRAVKALIEDEEDLVANLANVACLLATTLEHHWVGFYSGKGNDLVLGPFQGPVACTRIPR